MATNQRIRIRLKAYDHGFWTSRLRRSLRRQSEQALRSPALCPLPTRIEKFCVMRIDVH